MPIECKFDPERSLLVCTATGELTFGQMLDIQEGYLEKYLVKNFIDYNLKTLIGTYLFSEDPHVAEIMTTKEIAVYLKLHQITICKYASEGLIPAVRIGRVWRFDKDVIDSWIAGGQNNQ